MALTAECAQAIRRYGWICGSTGLQANAQPAGHQLVVFLLVLDMTKHKKACLRIEPQRSRPFSVVTDVVCHVQMMTDQNQAGLWSQQRPTSLAMARSRPCWKRVHQPDAAALRARPWLQSTRTRQLKLADTVVCPCCSLKLVEVGWAGTCGRWQHTCYPAALQQKTSAA